MEKRREVLAPLTAVESVLLAKVTVEANPFKVHIIVRNVEILSHQPHGAHGTTWQNT